MIPSLPQSFRITCTADGIAAPALLIAVMVRMNRKNHYSVVVGPTDAIGQVIVSRFDLETEIENAQNRFPADYATLSDSFSGQIDIRPMTLPQLQSAVDAHHNWNGIVTYPIGYLDRLLNGINALKSLNPHRLTVSIDDSVATTPLAILVPASVSDPVAELFTTVAV